jgi:hypothetical protein
VRHEPIDSDIWKSGDAPGKVKKLINRDPQSSHSGIDFDVKVYESIATLGGDAQGDDSVEIKYYRCEVVLDDLIGLARAKSTKTDYREHNAGAAELNSLFDQRDREAI